MGLPDGVAALRTLVDGQLAQLDEAAKAGRGSPSRMPVAVRAKLDGYARRILNAGTVIVPGMHPREGNHRRNRASRAGGAVENQLLVDVLTAQGRAYWKVTRRLVNDFLMPAWLEAFAGRDDAPEGQARDVATRELRRVLGLRFTGQLRDFGRITPLTARYARAKAAAGYGGQPVGIRTARLANASIHSAVLIW